MGSGQVGEKAAAGDRAQQDYRSVAVAGNAPATTALLSIGGIHHDALLAWEARQKQEILCSIRFRDLEPDWPISIVRLAQQPASPAVQAFLTTARAVMGKARM